MRKIETFTSCHCDQAEEYLAKDDRSDSSEDEFGDVKEDIQEEKSRLEEAEKNLALLKLQMEKYSGIIESIRGASKTKAKIGVSPSPPPNRNLQDERRTSHFEESSIALASLLSMQSMLPKFQVKPFNGDSAEPMFITGFKERVHNVLNDNARRMSILANCLSPALQRTYARELQRPDFYDRLLQSLEERYGQADRVSEACLDRLLSLPPTRDGDL